MIHDAFSAGVEPGGLYSSKDIKILICYMLAGAGEPMPRQAVLDVIAGNGMANFFEASAAIDELLRVGSLAELPGGGGGDPFAFHPLYPAGQVCQGIPAASGPDPPGAGKYSGNGKKRSRLSGHLPHRG